MNRKTKWSHRLLALALAAVMCCTYLPIGAFAETPPPLETTVAAEERQTNETETDNGQTDASSPDPGAATAEIAAPTTDEPAGESEPYTFDGEILYADMPDAPTGSYLGSYGLPVATGETKIGLGAWDADLEQDSYLSAEALDSDNLTLAAPLLEDADYAIVPILAQVEYPADGSALDLVLPDGVTLLDYYGAPVENAESLLHSEYSETSAAVLGVYVQADADFTAQLVYTAPDGSTLTKTLNVTIAESIRFTVLPTGEVQTVVMKDARTPKKTPQPEETPHPTETPQPTPSATPAPTPAPQPIIPQTGDTFPLGLLLTVAGISLAGLAVLIFQCVHSKAVTERDSETEDSEH